MQLALAQAAKGAASGEVPVGAVIIHDDKVIASAHNAPIALNDPCAHAEVLALREAGRVLQNYRLNETTLYVTLEPCPMCVYAMIHARVARCVFAASDPKTGALGGAIDLRNAHAWNHTIDVESGLLGEESAKMLRGFFKARRIISKL